MDIGLNLEFCLSIFFSITQHYFSKNAIFLDFTCYSHASIFENQCYFPVKKFHLKKIQPILMLDDIFMLIKKIILGTRYKRKLSVYKKKIYVINNASCNFSTFDIGSG